MDVSAGKECHAIETLYMLPAILLVAVASYTDIKEGKIYNKHTVPVFVIGIMLAVIQKRYDLILGAVIAFGFFYIFFAFPGFVNKLAKAFGSVPVPEGKRAMGGGDVKLATALAVYTGYLPVLYGTALGALAAIVINGFKLWRATGTPQSVFYLAAGKISQPVAFGPYLGLGVLVCWLLS